MNQRFFSATITFYERLNNSTEKKVISYSDKNDHENNKLNLTHENEIPQT